MPTFRNIWSEDRPASECVDCGAVVYSGREAAAHRCDLTTPPTEVEVADLLLFLQQAPQHLLIARRLAFQRDILLAKLESAATLERVLREEIDMTWMAAGTLGTSAHDDLVDEVAQPKANRGAES